MPTATQDLASELRPRSLDEVIGHNDIKPIIKKYIEQERQHWLFYGPTGAGKTSLAYIVARQLRGSDDDSEILDQDCADLTANDVRELIRRTRTYPMGGKYRVVILDEVQHMPKAARSLLLKPLESAVSPTVWILCTMEIGELHKALRDRCAAFEVKPFGQRERHELVGRAASHLKYTGDTSKFLRVVDKHEIGSAREILGAFEKLVSGMPAEGAIGDR